MTLEIDTQLSTNPKSKTLWLLPCYRMIKNTGSQAFSLKIVMDSSSVSCPHFTIATTSSCTVHALLLAKAS